MCDQVINEHFRRSLGRDYMNVFSSSRAANKDEKVEEFSQSTLSKTHSEDEVDSSTVTQSVSPSALSGISKYQYYRFSSTRFGILYVSSLRSCGNFSEISIGYLKFYFKDLWRLIAAMFSSFIRFENDSSFLSVITYQKSIES